MNLSLFFVADLNDQITTLSEETSKHIINVLRMVNGEEILLTDGKGRKAKARIIDDNRKKCKVEISSSVTEERSQTIAIGISLIKNASRFEWFLEKATEIGVAEIIPLICERTEKEKFRYERMQNILVSAMLQSQQSWLPVLHEPAEFKKALQLPFEKKFIAHCIAEKKQDLSIYTHHSLLIAHSSLLLIGPEGDFTANEVQLALQNNFLPVSLGATRLRTETAGIAAAVIMLLS